MTNPRSIIISLSSVKGRHGNNILHIMNLFAYSDHGIFILDRSYRQTIEFSRLSIGKRKFIFVPFVDRLIIGLSHLRFYVGKYLRINGLQKYFSRCIIKRTVYKFELSLVVGELLTNNFRADLHHRILESLQRAPETPGAAVRKYACHMRFGDFRTHRGGFLLYSDHEIFDIVSLLSDIGSTGAPPSLVSIYTDDKEAASEALGFEVLSKEQSAKQDWLDISRSNIIITNGSTFAISAFMLSGQAQLLVIPQRIYKMYIEQSDSLFSWLDVLYVYGGLIFLKKPHDNINVSISNFEDHLTEKKTIQLNF